MSYVYIYIYIYCYIYTKLNVENAIVYFLLSNIAHFRRWITVE